MVDVGGLVDLNSVAPALLGAYFEALGLDRGDLATFRTWRQQSRRLLNVSDLPRIIGKPMDVALLQRTATVHSGRSGLALNEVPDALRGLLSTALDLEPFASPASGVSYLVLNEAHPIGAVHFPPGGVEKALFKY